MAVIALFADLLELCSLGRDDVVGRAIALTAGSSRDQLTDDDVFLQSDQVIDLALDGRSMRSSKLNSPGMSPVASLNARSIGSGPQA